MSNKKRNISDVLLELMENMVDITKTSISVKRAWYWEYYKSIENDIKDSEERRKIYQQIYHLERFGYVSKTGLTAKGLLKIFKSKKADNELKKWDKKWRVVIFDIPEEQRVLRNRFRFFLNNFGFKLLQNSIWINPYADFDEVQKITKNLKIEQYVVLMVVDKISNDLLFKKKFDLI